MSTIKIVIGSWGSYSACNSRALGSSPIDLAAYSCWEQIEESLKKQGFDLSGIDAELFVQDIEGLPNNCADWDYINPKMLFEILNKSGVLQSEYLYTVLCACLEVRTFDEFAERVERLGNNWDDEVYLYEGYDWKITAKSCLKSANGGWTMTLLTTSTSRLTAEQKVLPARRNTATESSKSQEDKET